ncbi:MAG: excinuclease ABC subunit C [bacterium]|nr:excinuclease ABC subunit C [bacterium]
MIDEHFINAIDLATVPQEPGCYIYSDASGKIIYIGKAKNLKKRVSSYFQKRDLEPKTEKMVSEIKSAEFIVTDSEVEALILENTLIKKHRPKYNIDLKDSKSYAFIRLTVEDFPRLTIARNKQGKDELFGPFVSASARSHIMSVLAKTFKLRTCKRLLKKPCLRFHIECCPAPCIGSITKEAYAETIKHVRMVLKGKTKELLDTMTVEMNKASADMNFEHAMELRDQTTALKRLKERQKMERSKTYNEDVINYLVKNETVYINVFNVYKGTLENKQAFQFELRNDDFFEEFLPRYYSDNPIPTELIVPVEVSEAVTDFLKVKAGKAVHSRVPQRGEKKQLLELVLKNIEITFFGAAQKLEDLQDKLKMQVLPSVIECFDISHISGTAMVASMVRFHNAVPDKSNYRRYKIKTVEGVDDFSSIAEVVRRRYTRLKNENADIPDLILIDGGLGQLNAATTEIKKLKLRVPVISLAKRFEEIYIPGADEPLVLSRKTKALQLLQQIRDESHRFAITYNRLLRKKDLLKK